MPARIKPRRPEAPLTLSVEAAAKVLGVGRGTAYEWARTGQLPSIRCGRRYYVPRRVLEVLCEEKAEEARRLVAARRAERERRRAG